MLSGRAWMCSRRGASSGCIRGVVTLEHSRTGSYDWRGFTMNHPGMSGDFLGGLESCQHSSRRYPPDQERAVRMVAEISDEHGSEWAAISEVARLLGVGCAETVRKWVRQVQVDGGARPGIATEESAELKRLRRENAELRRANAILKTASAFFAAELDRPQH